MVNYYVYTTLPKTHQTALEAGYAQATSGFVSQTASQDPAIFKNIVDTVTKHFELDATTTGNKSDAVYYELSEQLGISPTIATEALLTAQSAAISKQNQRS